MSFSSTGTGIPVIPMPYLNSHNLGDVKYVELQKNYDSAMERVHELVKMNMRLLKEKGDLMNEVNELADRVKFEALRSSWSDPNAKYVFLYSLLNNSTKLIFYSTFNTMARLTTFTRSRSGSTSIAPSDSISRRGCQASPIHDQSRHQPTTRPPQFPPEILWLFED